MRCRRLVLVFLLVCCAGCAQFVAVPMQQPEFVAPPKADTRQVSLDDLEPLRPVVRSILLSNIKAWKLELKQWEETARVYNEGVRRRNEQARERLSE